MRQNNPISLFSFQDIVTCLTGIMIIVVLVILLQLVETAANITSRAKPNAEYFALRKHYDSLAIEKEHLQRRLAASESDDSEFNGFSLPELRAMKDEEEKSAVQLETTREEAEKQLAADKKRLEESEEQLKYFKEQIAKLSANEEQLAQQRGKLAELLKRSREIADQIERKRRTLGFEFPGVNDRVPLLIECNVWGFRVRKYPDGPVTEFGHSGPDGATTVLDDLIRRLASEDLMRCYPVLLFRPGTLSLQQIILNRLADLKDGMPVGQEPVSADEIIFEEESEKR